MLSNSANINTRTPMICAAILNDYLPTEKTKASETCAADNRIRWRDPHPQTYVHMYRNT